MALSLFDTIILRLACTVLVQEETRHTLTMQSVRHHHQLTILSSFPGRFLMSASLCLLTLHSPWISHTAVRLDQIKAVLLRQTPTP